MDARDNYEVCCGESKVRIDSERSAKAKAKLSKHFEDLDIDLPPIKSENWHIRFINLANHISQWSLDPSTKCGAVIVDKKRRIVSTGYNGLPRGIDDTKDRLTNRDTKYNLTLHAEVNALMFANVKVEGFTLYVTPLPPCIRCAVMIVQSGISTVVAPSLPDNLKDRWAESVERWAESVEQSKEIFAEAGINYIEV